MIVGIILNIEGEFIFYILEGLFNDILVIFLIGYNIFKKKLVDLVVDEVFKLE